jgi:hypothetical protein
MAFPKEYQEAECERGSMSFSPNACAGKIDLTDSNIKICRSDMFCAANVPWFLHKVDVETRTVASPSTNLEETTRSDRMRRNEIHRHLPSTTILECNLDCL